MAYIRHNYNIAPLTWLKVGGIVKTLFIPKNFDEIQEFIKTYPPEEINSMVILGAVSNSLILNGYLDKIVLKTTNLNSIQILDNYQIKVESGTLDKSLANFCLNNGIGGLEFLDSIPGTLGGNILTNAGCYGKEIKDILVNIEVVTKDGQLKILLPEDFQFSYRKCHIPQNILMIYSVTLQGYSDTYDNIKTIMDTMASQREATQPTSIATCGCTFKNPLPQKAWELINKSGAKDLKINGVGWSSLHNNFLDNKGKSGDDIYKLCKMTQELVKEKFNIDLELEIFIFGTPAI
jgi:UDP-N-acetylmuramate dehydrogenase